MLFLRPFEFKYIKDSDAFAWTCMSQFSLCDKMPKGRI